MNDNIISKVPSWQWMAGIAITFLLLIASAILSETRSDVKTLYASKLDKDAYYRDVGEIKGMMSEIRGDLKKLTGR